MKIELRKIKNGVVIVVDGSETYYEQAEDAIRKTLPMIQGLLTDWQKHRGSARITVTFDLLST